MPQNEIVVFGLEQELRKDRRLNLIIKLLSTVFILFLIGFIAFYSSTKYAQNQDTPQQRAINLAIKLIRENPKDTAARVRLGILYTQAGLIDEAIEQFDEVLKIERDNQEALLYAGVAHLNQDKYDKALKYFNKHIKYYKNTSMAMANTSLEQSYYYGGVAYWKLKKNDKALTYLEKSLEISPASDTYMVMGRIYLEKKQHDEAKKVFESALDLDPNYPDALYGLGLVYEAKGDKAKALDSFKAAVKSKPDFQMAKDAVARLSKGSKT